MSAVETCVNGKEALKLLRDKDKNFDLVLSDVYMPGEMQTTPSNFCRVVASLLASWLLRWWRACCRHGWLQTPGASWAGDGYPGHQ